MSAWGASGISRAGSTAGSTDICIGSHGGEVSKYFARECWEKAEGSIGHTVLVGSHTHASKPSPRRHAAAPGLPVSERDSSGQPRWQAQLQKKIMKGFLVCESERG